MLITKKAAADRYDEKGQEISRRRIDCSQLRAKINGKNTVRITNGHERLIAQDRKANRHLFYD